MSSPQSQHELSAADDEYFMALAFLASTRSKDGDTQVGACIVSGKPLTVLGLGYNGMPDGDGFKDCGMPWTKPDKQDYVCHAEMNAVISAFRCQADLSQSTLYVTYSPCAECCKLIIQCGIKKVCYAKEYFQRIDGYVRPGQAKRNKIKDGKERFHPVDEYLKPLHDKKEMNVRKYEEQAVKYVIDLGNPLEKPSEKVKHCERKVLNGGDQVGGDQGGKEDQDEGGDPHGGGAQGQGKGKRDVDLSIEDFFMGIAKLASSRSIKQEIGACLVTRKPHRVVSVSYCICCEDLPEVCAESIGITNAFRVHADLTDSVLYTTSPPCYHCAKIIVQSGVKHVIYAQTEEVKDMRLKPTNPHAVDEIFRRAGITYLRYPKQTKKRYIEIDLKKKDYFLKTEEEMTED